MPPPVPPGASDRPALRALALVADDLGESAATNTGIAAALEAGAVRETSLMVTGRAVEEGARVALAAGAATGLHLSFTAGQALTGRLHGLTRRDGGFLGLASALAACRLGIPRADEVRREVEAQWERLEGLGIRGTHLNGHHHAHAFPGLRDAVVALVKERGIAHLRVPLEGTRTGGVLSLRRLVVARQARGLSAALARAGLTPPPLSFAGLSLESRPDFGARLEQTLARLPPGPAEIMVHPRLGPPSGAAETACLGDASLAERLAAHGWRVATLAQAVGPQAVGGSGP